MKRGGKTKQYELRDTPRIFLVILFFGGLALSRVSVASRIQRRVLLLLKTAEHFSFFIFLVLCDADVRCGYCRSVAVACADGQCGGSRLLLCRRARFPVVAGAARACCRSARGACPLPAEHRRRRGALFCVVAFPPRVTPPQLVQFFGTGEYYWSTRRVSWRDALAAKKDEVPRIQQALHQAAALAQDATRCPANVAWWSLPPDEAAAAIRSAVKRPRAAKPACAEPGAPSYVRLRRSEWVTCKPPKPVPKDASAVCQCASVRPPPAAAADASPAPPLARTACGAGCLNRSSNTFCDARTCPSGAACSNRPFHLLRMPRAQPFPTQGRGWGLRAAEPVRKGEFVVEYIGEILDDAACERRLWADKAAGETNFYMMEVARNQVIDARVKGNTSRLINSACDPNCETQRWVDGATAETRVGIFALRDIPAGEEFTCGSRCARSFVSLTTHLTQLRLPLPALRGGRRGVLRLLLRVARLPRHAGREAAEGPQRGAARGGAVGRRRLLRGHRGGVQRNHREGARAAKRSQGGSRAHHLPPIRR